MEDEGLDNWSIFLIIMIIICIFAFFATYSYDHYPDKEVKYKPTTSIKLDPINAPWNKYSQEDIINNKSTEIKYY